MRSQSIEMLTALVTLAVLSVCMLTGTHSDAEEAAKPVRTAFYVAPDGNDQWSGTRDASNAGGTDGPFASLARARNAVRQLKAEHGEALSVRIFIRGGTYWLTEPIVFEPQDSGTARRPVLYEAYHNEQPVFSGGRRITGWQEVEDGLWTVTIPEVKAGDWYFRQLFVNGRRAIRARVPNQGEYYEAVKPIHPEDPSGFYFQPGEIKTWDNLGDVEVVLYHHWDTSRLKIAKVNEAENLVTFLKPAHYYVGWRNASRYFVENVFEELDAPGEWYLNRERGILYYRPRLGEDMTQAEVIAPVLNNLISFSGDAGKDELVSHIRLRGIALRHSVGTAVELRSAVDCRLEQCEVAHVGGSAVVISSRSQKNRIVACHIYDMGGNGVSIPGSKNINTPLISQTRENQVTDCHIHHGGMIRFRDRGISIGYSGHNLIAHNHVHDFDYIGIVVGVNWRDYENLCRNNIVEFNYIHHVMKVLTDGGAIYTMGNIPGTILRNNLIHDVYGDKYTPRTRSHNRGIFLDGMSGGILIENNIVYNTLHAPLDPYTENTQSPNTYVNNIFALPGYAIMSWSRRADNNNPAHHNIVYGVEQIRYEKAQSAPEKYTRLVNDNLYWHPTAEMTFNKETFAEWQAAGFDTRSIIADPLFADPEHGDFSLPPDSPAWDIGFQPIDMSTVGPRRPLKWEPPSH